ncbi:MAG: nitroreductase family protein [Atopobiaceae bacterium]|jgi:hypothetical protein
MMTIQEAMEARHAVRAYTDEPISQSDRAALNEAIAQANAASGLSMQLVCDEPRAFTTGRAHFGSFKGVSNYLVLAGPDSPELDGLSGYWGEGIVLLATQLGLDSCWVALTFGKGAASRFVEPGQRLSLVASLGHGVTHGVAHTSKPADRLVGYAAPMSAESAPAWFSAGVRAALLAPTATNQQKFRITCTGEQSARLENLGGPYSAVDLGIVRHDFELGAGKGSFAWE